MEGKEEYIFLKKENQRLLDENRKLRIENAELKDRIQKYEENLFASGISDSRNVMPSIGNEAFCASKNAEMIEASFQPDNATDTHGKAAVYVNTSQIQVSFDQLLPLSEGTPQRNIDKTSSTPKKLELFHSLFCGRTDVYAKRYNNLKSGKTGYAPVCANAGTPHLCDKKKYTCGECPNRELIPLSDKVICNHIIGKDELARDVIGIYPIFPDNTVCFLAIDLDKENWRTDLNAILTGCRRVGIYPLG